MGTCNTSHPNTHTDRKVRRILRSVARSMRRLGFPADGTKYQQMSRRFR